MPWLKTNEKKWGRGKNGPFYKGSDGNKQQETAGKSNNKRAVLILLILKQLFLFLFTALLLVTFSTNSSDYHLLVVPRTLFVTVSKVC